MDLLKELLFQIAQGALEVLLPILAAMAVRWVIAKVAELRGKISADKLAIIDAVVRIAVQAAEQMGLAGKIEDKKQAALEIAQAYLDEHGITLDIGVLEALIEAAVMAEFNQYKSLPGVIEVTEG